MTAQRGFRPTSRADLGRSSLGKIDRLAGGLAQLAAKQGLEALLAASGYPVLVVLAPGEMPGPADRRGKPDLVVWAVLVQQELGPRLGFDGQDPAHDFGIQASTGGCLHGLLNPRQRGVGEALELAVIHG